MNALFIPSKQEFPFYKGVKSLVSLSPLEDHFPEWSYTMLVETVDHGELKGSILPHSLLAEYIVIHDCLKMIYSDSSFVFEGQVEIVSKEYTNSDKRIWLEMHISELKKCAFLKEDFTPRT